MDSIILQLQMLGHILLAMGLGAAIGFEREWADKPAGLRTHMLVGGAAALLTSMTDPVIWSVDVEASIIRSDPIRIIQAIITGISFLGAGTILRRRDGGDVEGLTTAASLLFVAGIGVAVAASQYVLAVGATLLGLAVLYVMKSLITD